MKIFLDSDVVISSLISDKGAAYLLVNQLKVEKFISNLSISELKQVFKRLNLDPDNLELTTKRFEMVKLKQVRIIKKEFEDYVSDLNDSHVVAGAFQARVKFLITYNLRHFKIDKIKEDFNIIVLTPVNFLQYLRSK